ncbi:MAG: helix-turn-helix domain-containing protein [Gemmatimonadota bacterium]
MIQEKVVYTVLEAAELLGLGRHTAYEGVRSGVIPSVRVGRRILVPRVALEKLLRGDGQTATP